MDENKLYALNLAEDGRVLSATEDQYGAEGQPRVATLPSGETPEENDISNYRYVDSEFVYDPLPQPEPEEPVDRLGQLEADVMYISMMTGVDIPTLEV